MEEFSIFLEYLVLLPADVLIMGDFNFHVDDAMDQDAKEFLTLLDTFNLSQHIVEPTHKYGHTLDLMISKQGASLIKNVNVFLPWISDHSVVQANIMTTKPRFLKKNVTFRKWKHMDMDKYRHDLANAHFELDNPVTDAVLCYNKILQDLSDKHAPVNSRCSIIRPHAEWFTAELLIEKRKKRKLERNYRRTSSPDDAHCFKEHSDRYSQLLVTTRQRFYSDKIQNNAGDQKALFTVINKLLHRVDENQLPAHDHLSELTNRFADFFVTKISNIRAELCVGVHSSNLLVHESDDDLTRATMASFFPVTEEDVEKIIKKTNNKFCSLDPLPPWLLKQHLSILLPVITKVVNLSLGESVMPAVFKEALLTPILKKSSFNPELFKNFRPISNLAYVSKLIEKVADIQLSRYIEENNLDESMQSAYKAHHSTETAWVRLYNDILLALDDNLAVLLVCLDLSAAFDTIDHTILLRRLERRLGITGKCLDWFRSYLMNRKIKVTIGGVLSESKDLLYGVPQGSVLGPKLFTLYILPLGDLARKHGVNFHLYADDCQLYMSFKQQNCSVTASKMKCLVNDIKSWMTNNMLKLNEDKTEIIVLNGSRRTDTDLPSLLIGTETVETSESVTVLGLELDRTMCLRNHIRNVAKGCFFKLHNMFKIRKCITDEAAKTMVHSMITSKLDYCNSIFYGLPDCSLKSLSSVQKTAARLITGTKRYEHITPVMQNLHWLPIRRRIEYKILVLTFKCLLGTAPGYLVDLLQKRHNKGTRDDDRNFLVIPKVKRSTFAGRSFSFASPTLWNRLPDDLRLTTDIDFFKKQLKTYLFSLSYQL